MSTLSRISEVLERRRVLHTETVDEEVVTMVLPKHMDLRGLFAEGGAVHEEDKFDD